MEKIKENGSLYAVPSTNENSSITEMKELVANMVPVIAKPEKLFKDKEISQLYKHVKVQMDKIREEEKKEKQGKRLLSQETARITPKKKKKMPQLEMDSDYEEILSE
jgi:uncharacterized protein YaiI (UPF0178 family)